MKPEYRLRVNDYRVYYDVDEEEMEVTILGVVPKRKSEELLSDNSIADNEENDENPTE